MCLRKGKQGKQGNQKQQKNRKQHDPTSVGNAFHEVEGTFTHSR